jgi:hypothetical protein
VQRAGIRASQFIGDRLDLSGDRLDPSTALNVTLSARSGKRLLATRGAARARDLKPALPALVAFRCRCSAPL